MNKHKKHNLFVLANTINELFDDDKKINISSHTLVLIGAQSSGKTTLVHKIACVEFSPTGDGMMTRVPICVRLHNSERYNARLSVSDGMGKIKEIYSESFSEQTIRLEKFQQNIMEQTNRITKNKYSVSNQPIYVDIESPRVIDFSFVDLPGLVATWLDEQGQTESLIGEIKNLAVEYMMRPHTTVLAVMQSNADLQQNIGFALIKEVKSKLKNLNIIGILTKSDSLTNISKVEELVDNSDKSSTLYVSGGYYLVNNISDDEETFFCKKFPQSSPIITSKRYGIKNLVNKVSSMMIELIKESVPQLRTSVCDLITETKNKKKSLGIIISDSSQVINFLSNSISSMCEQIYDSLESNGQTINTGQQIGDIFSEFVANISKLSPYDVSHTSNEYFEKIINNFNGYHMMTQVSILKIVEAILADTNISSYSLIAEYALLCTNSICVVLEKTINYYTEINFGNFTKLKKIVSENLHRLIRKYADECMCFINQYIRVQSSHVWSSDKRFRVAFDNMNNKKSDLSTNIFNYTISQVRELVVAYFNTILETSQEFVIKSIVCEIIKKIEKTITNELNMILINQNIIQDNNMFCEDPHISKSRHILDKKLEKLYQINNMIDMIG